MLSKMLSKVVILFMVFEILLVLDYILEIIIPCISYFCTQVL
jgi:hypothetical protein